MEQSSTAPVIIFTYNRPEHTKRTIRALAENELAKETDLYIFSDAAKKRTDSGKVRAIRDYAAHVRGFRNVELVSREENYGLARNIIEGVTEIIARYGKVIVLEDDLVANPYFLRFMNDGLNRYEEEQKVTGITGFSYFNDNEACAQEMYFSLISGTSWSWATWKDRWDCFDEECADWTRLTQDARLRKTFNYDNTYDFYRIMKAQQTDPATSSWAIRWYWTNFKKEGLMLYPAKSLVSNDGWDGTGIHCGEEEESVFLHELKTDHALTQFPDEVCEKKEIRRMLKRSLLKAFQPSVVKRMYHNIFRTNYIGQK